MLYRLARVVLFEYCYTDLNDVLWAEGWMLLVRAREAIVSTGKETGLTGKSIFLACRRQESNTIS